MNINAFVSGFAKNWKSFFDDFSWFHVVSANFTIEIF